MKAILLRAHGPIEDEPLELAELEDPIPDGKQILIRISVCGLCHTDLDEIEGRLEPKVMPIVLGHQIVGTVAGRGADARRFQTGQRVGVTWFYSSCGLCSFCQSGRENLCAKALWTGKDVNGGYAEYMIVPEDSAHVLPDSVPDVQAAPLLCAGVIGYRTVRLAEITNGQTVGLFGFGASAHIVIQVVRYLYPDSPVFVFTRSGDHQHLARYLGAAWVGLPDDRPPVEISRAMDFTPAGRSVPTALEVMERGGRLVINAIRKTTPVPELDYARHLWHEREIKSVANVTRRDAEEFLALAGSIPIRPEVRQFAFEQVNEALVLLKQSRINGAAVLQIG